MTSRRGKVVQGQEARMFVRVWVAAGITAGITGAGSVAWATPAPPPATSASLFVTDPVELADFEFAKPPAGNPAGGWLVLSTRDISLSQQTLIGRRIDAAGAVIDAVPFELGPLMGDVTAMWDGVQYQVPATTFQEYYELTATIDTFVVPPTGAVVPSWLRVTSSAGWPFDFAGACDPAALTCSLTFTDSHWLTTLPEVWVRWDLVAGATVSPVAGGLGGGAVEAVQDGDALLAALESGDLVWFPPAGPEERLVLGHPVAGLALGPGGVSLVVWLEQDGGPGDSASPNFARRLLAQRVHRTQGVLDATPIDLGGYEFTARVDVAFTGASFAVTVDDSRELVREIHRVLPDGGLLPTVPVADPAADAEFFGGLAAGAPGHLLWLRSTCPGDDPSTSFCDGRAASYRVIEVDVPSGGLCSDDAACVSGSCVAGVCDGEAPTTPPTTPPTTTEDTGTPGTTDPTTPGGGDDDDDGGGAEPAAAGCGCSAAPAPTGGVLLLLAAGLVRMRRQRR